VEDLGADGRCGLEESLDCVPVGGAEGDVGLAEAVAGLLPAYPECRDRVEAVTDGRFALLHDPFSSQAGEHGVVESGARLECGALDGHVSEHGEILAARTGPGAIHRARAP
jgi:hypothetical protein